MSFDGHAVLIDGSGFAHRAWTVAPADASGARPASGIFEAMLKKLLRRMRAGRRPPSHIAVFFDPPRELSWRRRIDAGYKANRGAYDPAFVLEVGRMKDACTAIGLAHATAPCHEADDLVAAYALDAHAAGLFVTMVSTDKDLMQMIRPGIVQYDAKADRWYRAAEVREKFGVGPERLADYLALCGDGTDGIRGARGIGPKSAAAILLIHGSLGDLLVKPDLVENESYRRKIVAARDDIALALRLVAFDVAGAPRLLAMDDMSRLPVG